MSEEPRKNKGLRRALALGAAITVIGGAGAVLVTYAQERTAETPAQVLTADVAPAATPDKPVSYAELSAQETAVQVRDQTVQSSSASAATRPSIKQAFRGDTLFGRPILQRRPQAPAKVDWQKAMTQVSQAPKRLAGGVTTRLQKNELDKTRLPVILPRDGGMIDGAKARLLSFGDAYALNMPQKNGMQITAYGNRSFVPADSGAVSKRPVQKLLNVAEDVRISRMEDGWTATFTRYDVVYSIDVTCDDINAPDCQNDGYIRKAVAEFSDVTMGAQAQAEAQTAKPQTSWVDSITSMFAPKKGS